MTKTLAEIIKSGCQCEICRSERRAQLNSSGKPKVSPPEPEISQSQLTSAYEDSLIREANKCRAIAWDEFGL